MEGWTTTTLTLSVVVSFGVISASHLIRQYQMHRKTRSFVSDEGNFVAKTGAVACIVGLGMFGIFLFLALPTGTFRAQYVVRKHVLGFPRRTELFSFENLACSTLPIEYNLRLSGSQIGLCLFLFGFVTTLNAMKAYVIKNGVLHLLPAETRDLLIKKSFVEFWEAPPPPWLIRCVEILKHLILLGVAKSERDRRLILRKLPSCMNRKGTINTLPIWLQRIILPSFYRDLRDTVPNPAVTPPSRNLPSSETSSSSRGGAASAADSTATSSSALPEPSLGHILRNRLISDLRDALLRIPREPLHLSCLISSGALVISQQYIRRFGTGFRHALLRLAFFLSSLSTSGLLAVVLARMWAQRTASRGELSGFDSSSVLVLLRSLSSKAVMLAYRKIRALLLLCLRRLKRIATMQRERA